MPFWSSDVCSRSEEHTSELQSHSHLVCRLLLEKKTYRKVVSRPSRRSIAAPPRRTGPPPSPQPTFPFAPPGRTRWRRSSRPTSVFFNDTATTEIYTLSLHDALPI